MAEPVPDDRDELRALARGVRRHAEGLARAGAWGAPRGAAAGSPAPGPEPPPRAEVDVAPAAARGSLAVVREDLGECTRCKLSGSRTNIVFGVGAQDTPLMFVGEAPGAEEDRRGEPFVGRAGQLLDRMIAAMGWGRESVYIANVLKCRPPGNRDPQPD